VYIIYDQSTQKEQLSFKDSIDMNTAKKNTAKNVSSKVTTTSSSAPITSAKVTRSVKRPSAAPTKPDQTITKTSIRKSVAKKTTPEKKIAKKSTLTTLTKLTLNLEEVNHQKSKPKASPSKKVLKAKQTKEIIKVAEKPKKNKVVRDSFTIPKDEYQTIQDLKMRSSKLGHSMKKSELIRAGIKVLSILSDSAFTQAIAQIPMVKTGRPKKLLSPSKSL
jgi:hypothetical protein